MHNVVENLGIQHRGTAGILTPILCSVTISLINVKLSANLQTFVFILAIQLGFLFIIFNQTNSFMKGYPNKKQKETIINKKATSINPTNKQ